MNQDKVSCERKTRKLDNDRQLANERKFHMALNGPKRKTHLGTQGGESLRCFEGLRKREAMSDRVTDTKEPPLAVLVTGGNGFLGAHVANVLQKEKLGFLKGVVGEIRVFDKTLQAPEHSTFSGDVYEGDVTNKDDVRRACEGVDVVLHCAAIVVEGSARAGLMERVNVGGTKNLLDLCAESGGPRMFISAGSVTAAMGDFPNDDTTEEEELPDSDRVISGEYGRTKNLADRLVRSYNGRKREDGRTVHTMVLRIPPMYGEGDLTNVVEAVKISRALCGYFTPVGSSRCQNAYVVNVAYGFAHALLSLHQRPDVVGGEAFYLCDDTPTETISSFMEPFLIGCGCRIAPVSLPLSLAYVTACILELGVRAATLVSNSRPTVALTRRNLRMIRSSRVFSDAKARRQLGYQPPFSHSESLERCIPYYQRQCT